MPVDNDLHKAAHKGDLETCKMLIEGSVDEETPFTVNDEGAAGRRPLHRAAGAGHLQICEYFLSLKAEIDAKDTNYRTALHWASIGGFTEVVNFLLQNGANILAVTKSNATALHMSVEGSRVETVRALMAFVATVDKAELKTSLTMMKNADSKTAWEIAVAANNTPVYQVLKDMGDTNGASSSCLLS